MSNYPSTDSNVNHKRIDPNKINLVKTLRRKKARIERALHPLRSDYLVSSVSRPCANPASWSERKATMPLANVGFV